MLAAFALALLLGEPATLSSQEPSEIRGTDPDAPWIRYTLRKGEHVEDLATRYDVTLDELAAANGGVELHVGDVVALQPRRFARPMASRTIKTSERSTWDQVAARRGVSVEDLKHWNDKLAHRKSLAEGTALTVWVASGVTRFPFATQAQPLPDFEVPDGAYSIGKPHRGRIHEAVALPESELYTLRIPRLAYGSSLSVRNIQRAIAGFRRDSGFAGELFIGAMSRQSGRKLRPHRSHQSGRDLDIRMPAMPDAEGFALDRSEIDWHATWVLVDSFIRTDAVAVIFLERKLFARLRTAALRMGATDERLETVMAKVRHSKGHTSHIHVRFECAPDAPECVDD